MRSASLSVTVIELGSLSIFLLAVKYRSSEPVALKETMAFPSLYFREAMEFFDKVRVSILAVLGTGEIVISAVSEISYSLAVHSTFISVNLVDEADMQPPKMKNETKVMPMEINKFLFLVFPFFTAKTMMAAMPGIQRKADAANAKHIINIHKRYVPHPFFLEDPLEGAVLVVGVVSDAVFVPFVLTVHRASFVPAVTLALFVFRFRFTPGVTLVLF